MLKKIVFIIFVLLTSTGSIFSQNRFEGKNVVISVPEDHKAVTCAVRFVPTSTNIIISDLNAATPFQPKPCAGNNISVVKNTSLTASVKASSNDANWCFEGEDKMYRISFQGDQYTKQVSYNWIANASESIEGIYNVKSFGAVGDGRTDDTIAIRSALAYIGVKNGGKLLFPEGEFIVTDSLAIPPGITIQGVSGVSTEIPSYNNYKRSPTRITLRSSKKSLFKIGECIEEIAIKDIELYAENSDKTIGVEATGAYNTSQDIYFENVTFHNFFRGIQAIGLPQTNKEWQFDLVKVNRCRFVFNTDTGIYNDVRNSDWRIDETFFVNPKKTPTQNANSMHFERVGMVLIEDTYGGGFRQAPGGTFINILDSGNMTIINSETEFMTNAIVYNEVKNPYAGDYSYPITIINSIFGLPIVMNARRTFVSVGSLYGPNTFKMDERVRVYSTGDRFCYDGYGWACESASNVNNKFDKATVVFMTGQPGEGKLKGHPTYFGTDVEFGSPVQMPTFRFNELPNGKPNGSMIYCSDCQRDQTPCRSGGNGSPAMMVNGRWSCL